MDNDLTKKYYSIGEVSEILNIPAPTLRYWEKQFPSTLRPGRNSGGQRRYTPADVERIRMVWYLVKERGMHIEAAQRQIASDPDGVSHRFRAIETLRRIREQLQQMADALGRLR